jgi:hypothetical protein
VQVYSPRGELPERQLFRTLKRTLAVLIHTEGREIITTSTDKAGNLVKQIVVFPANKQRLTNLDTGKSIVATGPFHGRREPDGSATIRVTGHGIFPGHPITEEPGFWYLSGRIIATLDAEENLTSIDSTGKLVDLCVRLGTSDLSGRPDLNRRPHRPERCALPGCATPRGDPFCQRRPG